MAVAAAIQQDLRNLRAATTPSLRAVRRSHARALATEPADSVTAVIAELLDGAGWPERVIAYELLQGHAAAFRTLNDASIESMADGLADWGSIDLFGVTIAGPAWRERLLSDTTIQEWVRSPNRWRRRLSLVATVGLNSRARGGSGDARRTLRVCRQLIADRDPMVVKAMSWALRELAKRDSKAVKDFVTANEGGLPALVRREVLNKLRTGVKSPRRKR